MDIDPNRKMQTVRMPGRNVTIHKLAPDDFAACRYVARCGCQAIWQVKEPGLLHKDWFWCGMCEPGRQV